LSRIPPARRVVAAAAVAAAWAAVGSAVIVPPALGAGAGGPAGRHALDGAAPVTIGLLVPTGGEEAGLGREILFGARIAVAEANAEGGIAGRPLRLVAAPAEGPWRGAASSVVRLIYDEGAVAVVGALDGPTAHVAEQVVARAKGEAVFVTPWASEASLTRIRIPWFFSVVPDDRRQAEALARAIFGAEGPAPGPSAAPEPAPPPARARRAAIWVDDAFDARAAASSFEAAAPAGAVARHEAARPGDRQALISRAASGGTDAVVLFAAPAAAADLVRDLRRAGSRADLLGPLSLAVPEFIERAGAAAESVRLVAPEISIHGERARAGRVPPPREPGPAGAFRRAFETTLGRPPAAPALFARDAVAAVVEALRGASPARRLPGDLAGALARVSFEGVTGPVRFDEYRGRAGLPAIAALENGTLEVSAESPEPPTEPPAPRSARR
jgi:branched-chain amino acid transport system substrate-binding protein